MQAEKDCHALSENTFKPVVTFVVPCYNSAGYMRKCIDSILVAGSDIELIIVDDGSSDETYDIANSYAKNYPDIVRVIHQENGGHGAAVNTGLNCARGLYFKVVDSDDWLDECALLKVLDYVRSQANTTSATDLVISNYVYDKVELGEQKSMNYRGIMPREKQIRWEGCAHFPPTKYILMHSVMYRTQLLKDISLRLPSHCFYVDNIFVYVPLAHVKSLYYIDVDLYHYFIGRVDQSVNEETMISRLDQQLRITKKMIDSVNLCEVHPGCLRTYMYNYLSMMMCICTVFLRMKHTAESDVQLKDIWNYLKRADARTYWRVRTNVVNMGTNIPGEVGRKLGLSGYRLAQRIFKFN